MYCIFMFGFSFIWNVFFITVYFLTIQIYKKCYRKLMLVKLSAKEFSDNSSLIDMEIRDAVSIIVAALFDLPVYYIIAWNNKY